MGFIFQSLEQPVVVNHNGNGLISRDGTVVGLSMMVDVVPGESFESRLLAELLGNRCLCHMRLGRLGVGCDAGNHRK